MHPDTKTKYVRIHARPQLALKMSRLALVHYFGDPDADWLFSNLKFQEQVRGSGEEATLFTDFIINGLIYIPSTKEHLHGPVHVTLRKTAEDDWEAGLVSVFCHDESQERARSKIGIYWCGDKYPKGYENAANPLLPGHRTYGT